MSDAKHDLYLAGVKTAADATIRVLNKYNGNLIAEVGRASAGQIEQAIAFAHDATPETSAIPAHARQAILLHVHQRLGERREEFARVIAQEAGKPIQQARSEVDRARDTFRTAAEEAVRINGQWLPLDISSAGEPYQAITRRFPIGPCAFITPFNFPLNLVAHKVAPAIASGCPWVLKPASATPITALMLGDLLAETDWPRGAWSILPSAGADAERMASDDRIKLLSFTGSAEIGWRLKQIAWRKRVVLELGGNAPCIVEPDADLEHACRRIAYGAFYQAGQSCISVQRVLVHRDIHKRVADDLVEITRSLPVGDPLDDNTVVGPLITQDDAIRVENAVRSAVAGGAKLLCGGTREGSLFAPTWVDRVPHDHELLHEEIFGPVAVIQTFDDFEHALKLANNSRYGLQAGLFTRDVHRILRAFAALEFGGVIANDIPSVRIDSMPYGGVKDSGVGREGVRDSIEEMTQPRLLVLRHERFNPAATGR